MTRCSCGVLGVIAALVFTIAGSGTVHSQDRMPRIGWLGIDFQMQAKRYSAFEEELRRLGHVDGKTIVIERRWAEGRLELLSQLANELVASRVDIIVTAAPPAIRAAQSATKTIPIVAHASDSIGLGFINSFSHPGGNITGIAFQDSELSTKRLEYLRQLVPNLNRLAIIWNEGGGPNTVRDVETAARSLGMQVLSIEVRQPADLKPAVEKAKAWGAQGVAQLASPVITRNRALLLEALAANRLPASCEMRDYVVDGCLMTYSADLNAMFRGLARYVDRLLKGTKIEALPVEQPSRFEFVVNATTAKSLGLVIPRSMQIQISEVIQ